MSSRRSARDMSKTKATHGFSDLPRQVTFIASASGAELLLVVVSFGGLDMAP